jgi:hypothetical protein
MQKLSGAKVGCKVNLIMDVMFKENSFVNDWIINNHRLNWRKRVKAISWKDFLQIFDSSGMIR